jgi:hypothetical protein
MVSLSRDRVARRAELGLTLSDWSWFAVNAQIAAVICVIARGRGRSRGVIPSGMICAAGLLRVAGDLVDGAGSAGVRPTTVS